MKSLFLIATLLLLLPFAATTRAQGCGDLNTDGQIDLADVAYFINWMMFNGPNPDYTDADMDGCPFIDINDLEFLLNYLYNGGPYPCTGGASCTYQIGGRVVVAYVDGESYPGYLDVGVPITFHLRYFNNTIDVLHGLCNSFVLYSPDGATWDNARVDTTGEFSSEMFPLLVKGVVDDMPGLYIDTFKAAAISMPMTDGWVDSSTAIPFTITIGPFGAEDVGKTITLDSISAVDAGVWRWSVDGLSAYYPEWGGPYSYTIGEAPIPPDSASISLAGVDGLVGEDSISCGVPVTFYVRVSNHTEYEITGLTNGFEVYSPDGAEWGGTVGDTIGTIGLDRFDLVYVINYASADGIGADSLMFGGASMVGTGLEPGFDEVSYAITVGPIDSIYDGYTICLDSTFFPPAGEWLWSSAAELIVPSWDGPHCFTIAAVEPPPPPPANADSLILPSVVALPTYPGLSVQPVVCKLTQPIKGATIPIKVPDGVEILGVDFDSLITANWDYKYTFVKPDSGFLFVALANSFGEVIPAGISVAFNILFMARNADCEVERVFYWDTTLMGDVSRQLTFVDTTIHPLYPGFSMFRDSVVVLPYEPGDMDGNGSVNIADLVYLVDYMFAGGPPPLYLNAMDINGDCVGPDVADLVYMVEYMFLTGAEPFCGCPVGTLVSAVARNSEIVFKTVVQDGATTVICSSPIDLRGLQFEMRGSGQGEPEKLTGNLDLVFGQKEGSFRAALLDLNGGEYLRAGTHELVRLTGEYELVSARVADMNIQSVEAVVEQENSTLPERFDLFQNYPNPFNPVTEISFNLPEASRVKLEIYNVLGQKVVTLVDRPMEAGSHTVQWNGTDDRGRSLSSGIYLYRFDTDAFTATKKMMLLK